MRKLFAVAMLSLTAWILPSGTFGANHTIDGVVYNLNTSNMRASVQGLPDGKNPSKLTIPAVVTYKNKTYKVTSIAKEAFDGNMSIKTVVLGNNIESIGSSAFSSTNVSSITFSNSLKVIGQSAFYNTELTKVELPASIEILRAASFAYNKNLTTLTFKGSKLTEIGDRAFNSCSKLKAVSMPNSVTTLGKEAFKDCDALTSVHISGKLGVIPEGAFENAPITDLVIPASVHTIGDGAFCRLATPYLTIPGTVKTIGTWAFFLATCNTIELNEGLVTLGEYAFAECYNIGAIALPESLVNVGEGVFYRCYGLHTCVLPMSMKKVPYRMFYDAGIQGMVFPEGVQEIGAEAFFSCGLLEYVTCPSSVRAIGDKAFYCCHKLENVYTHEGLLTVGEEAFRECDIKELTIPSTVTDIATRAFIGNFHMMKVVAVNPVPCRLQTDAFSDYTYRDATLCVPSGASQAYRSAQEWSRFERYDNESEVINPEVTDYASSTVFYDLSGSVVPTPENGKTYIKEERLSSGKKRISKITL